MVVCSLSTCGRSARLRQGGVRGLVTVRGWSGGWTGGAEAVRRSSYMLPSSAIRIREDSARGSRGGRSIIGVVWQLDTSSTIKWDGGVGITSGTNGIVGLRPGLERLCDETLCNRGELVRGELVPHRCSGGDPFFGRTASANPNEFVGSEDLR